MLADPGPVPAIIRRMSLAEKVGQLFVVPLGRHAPNALAGGGRVDGLGSVIDLIRRYRVGGVCYFAPGAQGGAASEVRAELAELNAAVTGRGPESSPERRADESGPRLAPVIAVDQEGGTVARLRREVTGVPGAMALAATGDPASAAAAAGITGAELRAVGFHQDYAPVADVNSNPANPVIGVRSYGSDPAEVSRYVVAAVQGLRDAGIAATVKHFPGHGDTATDSHLELPAVGRDVASWEAVDLAPFAAAIGAGVDAVMSAHVSVPAVDDSGDPATASPKILTGVLRDRLGFDGVVVTDALDMAGARQRFPGGEASVRALAAGADQLLMPADLPEAVEAVTAAVRDGRVPAARLDAAVRRVLLLKERLGLLDGRTSRLPRSMTPEVPVPSMRNSGGPGSLDASRPGPGLSGQDSRSPAGARDLRPLPVAPPDAVRHAGIARDLARRAVTVLGDRTWRPPSAGHVALVGALGGDADRLAAAFRRPGIELSIVDTGTDPADVSAALSAAAGAELTVVVTRAGYRWPGQRALLAGLTQAGYRHVLLALREPYDAGLAPAALATFLTYGDDPVLRDALLDVLAGDATPGGRLPVDVPGADGRLVYPRSSLR
jgi:beta-N-acetylhexosaminidase